MTECRQAFNEWREAEFNYSQLSVSDQGFVDSKWNAWATAWVASERATKQSIGREAKAILSRAEIMSLGEQQNERMKEGLRQIATYAKEETDD